MIVEDYKRRKELIISAYTKGWLSREDAHYDLFNLCKELAYPVSEADYLASYWLEVARGKTV